MMTKPGRNGIPALHVVGGILGDFRRLKRIRATIGVKRKTALHCKWVLCARGDLWRPDVRHWAIPPPLYRDVRRDWYSHYPSR